MTTLRALILDEISALTPHFFDDIPLDAIEPKGYTRRQVRAELAKMDKEGILVFDGSGVPLPLPGQSRHENPKAVEAETGLAPLVLVVARRGRNEFLFVFASEFSDGFSAAALPWLAFKLGPDVSRARGSARLARELFQQAVLARGFSLGQATSLLTYPAIVVDWVFDLSASDSKWAFFQSENVDRERIDKLLGLLERARRAPLVVRSTFRTSNPSHNQPDRRR